MDPTSSSSFVLPFRPSTTSSSFYHSPSTRYHRGAPSLLSRDTVPPPTHQQLPPSFFFFHENEKLLSLQFALEKILHFVWNLFVFLVVVVGYS
jgi:hypothetical protein